MRMLHLPDAWVGACAAFACLLLLTADSIGTSPAVLVGYLGSGADPKGDFKYFVKLARDGTMAFPPAARFELFDVAGDNAAGLEAAVRRAVGAHAVVIVAPNSRSAKAAVRRAPGTPIVFASADDPVASGLVSAMQRRPEPVTGVFFGDRLDGKRLELLKDAYPGLRRVAVIGDADWASGEHADLRVATEGRRIGLEVTPLLAETQVELHRLLDSREVLRFDGWYVPRSNIGTANYRFLIEAMRRMHKPCIFSTTTRVDDGGLMAYAQDETFMWRAMTELVSRVVAGEEAGSIPVMLPRTFVLAVRTAPDTQVASPDIRVVRRADIVLR